MDTTEIQPADDVSRQTVVVWDFNVGDERLSPREIPRPAGPARDWPQTCWGAQAAGEAARSLTSYAQVFRLSRHWQDGPQDAASVIVFFDALRRTIVFCRSLTDEKRLMQTYETHPLQLGVTVEETA